MNTNMVGGLSFLAGTVVGAYVGYRYFVDRERKIQEAIMAFEVELAEEREALEDALHEANLKRLQPEYEEVVTQLEYLPKEENEDQAAAFTPEQALESVQKEEEALVAETGVSFNQALFVPSADKPYLITETEAFESDCDMLVLSYYEGDSTVADTNDHIIHDVERVIGVRSLQGFGMCESLDNDVAYVMNEVEGRVYEVHRYSTSYSEFVLGLGEDFLEGSGHRKVPKMRRE